MAGEARKQDEAVYEIPLAFALASWQWRMVANPDATPRKGEVLHVQLPFRGAPIYLAKVRQ